MENETLVKKVYGNDKIAEYAKNTIGKINAAYETREQPSIVFNGLSYSQAYEYNQKKALGYAPPKKKGQRQVSFGIVHEKVISFVSIFLKYVWKRKIKIYNKEGNIVKGMGKIYDLAIEHSYSLEDLRKKVALIYWEVYSQGNAFVLEHWEVKNKPTYKAYKGKEVIKDSNIDYTLEFLDNLKYEKAEDIQTRRAVSVVLDGRQVIFADPTIEDIQEQPFIVIEEEYTKAEAEQMFGSLKRWKYLPKTRTELIDITGGLNGSKKLFAKDRLKDLEENYIVHTYFNKEENRYNIFVNGVMMLPMDTPMTIFYPRGNYPISNVAAERLSGSIYARSIPAKTKYNADWLDWALRMLTEKFEQGVRPPILAKGKYTITSDIFRAGQVTYGVTRDQYEKADPDNQGVTNPEFSFVNLMKTIIESQTVNQSYNGEISGNATATEIATVDANQRRKLALLLDGLVMGFTDMALRRAETIEAKYTLKRDMTVVDGKDVPVYQNFTINVSGVENVVEFSDEVGGLQFDEETKREELFQKAYKSKKEGIASEFYLVNPQFLREGQYQIVLEIQPELIKDDQLQMIQMFDEFQKLLAIFGRDSEGGDVNMAQLKKEYLDVTGRPDDLFVNEDLKKLQQAEATLPENRQAGYNMGSFGKQPNIKQALQESIK